MIPTPVTDQAAPVPAFDWEKALAGIDTDSTQPDEAVEFKGKRQWRREVVRGGKWQWRRGSGSKREFRPGGSTDELWAAHPELKEQYERNRQREAERKGRKVKD